jgi:PAS domain
MSILGELAAIDLEKAIAALRALWSRLRGETRVPLRSGFSPELLKPWLPNIVIVEAVGVPPRCAARWNRRRQFRRPRFHRQVPRRCDPA